MPPERIDYPPGSGPYYIADHITNRRIVLERNRYYRGGRTANPDRIVWTIEGDPTERLRATERGEYDWLLLFQYPDTIVRRLVDEYGLDRPGGRLFRSSLNSSSWKRFFRFNQDRRAFEGAGQAPLRKAINYVIDRPELARAGSYLAFTRSDRLLPEALSHSRRLYPLGGTAPVAARKWLARARWRPSALRLYTTNFPGDVKKAEVFAYNLLQLGIKVETYYFAFQDLQDKLNTPGEPWDVAGSDGTRFTAAYPDPAGVFIQLLLTPRWKARVDAANRVKGEAARALAWADLETDLMSNDPPVAAYAEWRPLILVSPSLGCYRPGQQFDIASVCKR
jgi:ABC-type oligopeptide transport system substrate-binding subunit